MVVLANQQPMSAPSVMMSTSISDSCGSSLRLMRLGRWLSTFLGAPGLPEKKDKTENWLTFGERDTAASATESQSSTHRLGYFQARETTVNSSKPPREIIFMSSGSKYADIKGILLLSTLYGLASSFGITA